MCQNNDIESGNSVENIELPDINSPSNYVGEQEHFLDTENLRKELKNNGVISSSKIAVEGDTETLKSKKKEKPSNGGSITRLFQFCKPERCMLFVGTLLMLGAEAATQIIPLIVAKAYNEMIDYTITQTNEEKMSTVNHYMLLSIITFLIGTFANFIRGSIFAIVGERMVARLRNEVYGSILIQDIAFFDEHKSGDLVSRLGSDTTLLQNVISTSLPEALVSIVKAVISIVLIFIISAKLAGVSIATFFVIGVLSLPLGAYLARLSGEYQEALGQAQTYSTEAIGSMRTVQSFTAELKEKLRFKKYIGDPDAFPYWYPSKSKTQGVKSTYSVGYSKSIVLSGFFSLVLGGGFGFLYVCLWYGFHLVNGGELTIGELTAFQSYVFNIGLGLGIASQHIAKIMEGIGASGRVFYLLDSKPTIHKAWIPNKSLKKAKKRGDDVEAVPLLSHPECIEGHIEFEDVTFAYPTRPDINVLDNYTLTIPPNTTTALVGSSGSGKSTVVALLQRFYDVNSGCIKIDGRNIKDLDLTWLRQRIGYVQQEPNLFGLSVRDNLTYGIPDGEEISQEQIEKACRDANAHDFISSWPDGYDTMVGERGVKLSGGQKQRISIARALVTDCRILLLDEATSALDAESEHLVQEAINKAVVGRSVIIVAHRLSTIQRASQIVVMSDHKIVDVGTHDQLLNKCGKYQDLIKRQSVIASSPSILDLNGLLSTQEEKEDGEEANFCIDDCDVENNCFIENDNQITQKRPLEDENIHTESKNNLFMELNSKPATQDKEESDSNPLKPIKPNDNLSLGMDNSSWQMDSNHN